MESAEGTEGPTRGARATLLYIFLGLTNAFAGIGLSRSVQKALVGFGVLEHCLGFAVDSKDEGPFGFFEVFDEFGGVAAEGRHGLNVFFDVEHLHLAIMMVAPIKVPGKRREEKRPVGRAAFPGGYARVSASCQRTSWTSIWPERPLSFMGASGQHSKSRPRRMRVAVEMTTCPGPAWEVRREATLTVSPMALYSMRRSVPRYPTMASPV